MDDILLDARSLQVAGAVLGHLDVRALLGRRPFPEQPPLEEARRSALAERLEALLAGREAACVLSAGEVDALVRCCRGSEAAAALAGTPWPHAWRYEMLFARLLAHPPRTPAGCRALLAELLLPQVRRQLAGPGPLAVGGSRSGRVSARSRLEEARRQLGAQLAALEALRTEGGEESWEA